MMTQSLPNTIKTADIFFYRYSFKTNDFTKITGDEEKKFLKERDHFYSPDNLKSVGPQAIENIIYTDRWVLYQQGKNSIYLGEKFTPEIDIHCSQLPSPCIYWLDNENFLAVKRDGTVLKIDTEGVQEELFQIPVPPPSGRLP